MHMKTGNAGRSLVNVREIKIGKEEAYHVCL